MCKINDALLGKSNGDLKEAKISHGWQAGLWLTVPSLVKSNMKLFFVCDAKITCDRLEIQLNYSSKLNPSLLGTGKYLALICKDDDITTESKVFQISYFISFRILPVFYCKLYCTHFIRLLLLFFDCSYKALSSSKEEFDIDFLSWFVTPATAQNMSSTPGEPQKHL